jgi:asparagine synthase (glutamine-hydrolysing)
LSSGLDSTSIAHFASTHFKFYSRTLYTYTSYPQYISEIPENKVDKSREEIRVRKFVEKNKNIESFCLNFENISISEQFHSADLDNYDPIIIGNTFWINGILKNAKQKGCKIILCGQLGNASLTWSAPYLTFSKLTNFRLKDLIYRIVVLSKKFNVTILTVVWYEIITPLKNFCRYKLYFRKFKESILNSSIFNVSSFREEFDLKDEVLKYVPGFTSFLTDENFRYAFLSKLSSKSGSKWYTLGQNYGIETTDPTSDKRLLEFTFRISEDYFNYFGDTKYIFKKMMNGRLPDYILHNKISAVQAYDIGLRIINDINFPELVKYLTTEKSYMYELDYSLISSQYNEFLKSNDLAQKFRISNIFLKNLSILNFIKKNT